MPESPSKSPARPVGPYWQDPVYRYVAGRHRSAADAGDHAEADRYDGFMQQLVESAMSDELYRQLDAEAKATRKAAKLTRKRQSKPPHYPPAEEAPSVNVADLKKRIFNPSVSRENVIKALEALPTTERKATIAGLPPGLRRKLGDYLQGKGH